MASSERWSELKRQLLRGDLGVLGTIRDCIADAAELGRGPGGASAQELLHDLVTSTMAFDGAERREIVLHLQELCLDLSVKQKKGVSLQRLRDQTGDARPPKLTELSLDPLARTELRNEVKAALRTLSRSEVEVLTLVHDGNDAGEIARIFAASGRSKSTAEVRALIARARLRYRHAIAASLRARREL